MPQTHLCLLVSFIVCDWHAYIGCKALHHTLIIALHLPQLRCSHLPRCRVKSRTKVVLLQVIHTYRAFYSRVYTVLNQPPWQHPLEERRAIRTGRMLELGLEEGVCSVVRGAEFSSPSPALSCLLSSPSTLLLYPGQEAVPLASLAMEQEPLTLLLLDGTWSQARRMWARSPALHKVRRVRLEGMGDSEYLVSLQLISCFPPTQYPRFVANPSQAASPPWKQQPTAWQYWRPGQGWWSSWSGL